MRILSSATLAAGIMAGSLSFVPAAGASDIPEAVVAELRDMMVSNVALISLNKISATKTRRNSITFCCDNCDRSHALAGASCWARNGWRLP